MKLHVHEEACNAAVCLMIDVWFSPVVACRSSQRLFWPPAPAQQRCYRRRRGLPRSMHRPAQAALQPWLRRGRPPGACPLRSPRQAPRQQAAQPTQTTMTTTFPCPMRKP